MTDIRNYIVPSPEFMATSHLASKQPGVNPMYCLFMPEGWIYYIKSAAGFPCDVYYFDADTLYQCSTEGPTGWTDPTSLKVFASKSTTSKQGGIAWCKLALEAPMLPLLSDSTYNTWLAGKIVTANENVGPATLTVEGPYTDTVGDLGTVDFIVINYSYAGQYGPTIERFWHAEGVGQCRWQLLTQVGGQWTVKTDNLFDQITPGGTPTLNFQMP